MSNGGVCRTAPARPGLLNSAFYGAILFSSLLLPKRKVQITVLLAFLFTGKNKLAHFLEGAEKSTIKRTILGAKGESEPLCFLFPTTYKSMVVI